MAKVIFGDYQLSGKVGSKVFANGPFGAYVRNLGAMTNPQTVYQQNQREIVAEVSNAWKVLSTLNKDSWEAFALANPVPLRRGGSGNLSGEGMFIKLNVWRRSIALDTMLTQAPAIFSGSDVEHIDYGGDPTWSPAQMNVNFSIEAGPTVPADHYLVVSATAPFPHQVGNSVAMKTLRRITYYNAGKTTPADIVGWYTARFGAVQEGMWVGVFCQLFRHYDSATGQEASYLSTGVTDVGHSWMLRPLFASP